MTAQEVMLLTPGSQCPSCKKYLLKPHCSNCAWLDCKNERCTALFDVETGRYSIKESSRA